MNLYWTEEADAERQEIRAYIARDKPVAAMALDELFEQSAARLLDNPGLGKPGRVDGTREWVAHTNYILVYDVTGEQLRILRLLHAARRGPNKS